MVVESKGGLDVLKKMDRTCKTFISMQFSPYEQALQTLWKDTFPCINNRIKNIIKFFKIITIQLCLNYNKSKALQQQSHNHKFVEGF